MTCILLGPLQREKLYLYVSFSYEYKHTCTVIFLCTYVCDIHFVKLFSFMLFNVAQSLQHSIVFMECVLDHMSLKRMLHVIKFLLSETTAHTHPCVEQLKHIAVNYNGVAYLPVAVDGTKTHWPVIM